MRLKDEIYFYKNKIHDLNKENLLLHEKIIAMNYSLEDMEFLREKVLD